MIYNKYDEYEKRTRKVFLVLKQVHKFRFLIIGVLVILATATAMFAITKGTIYNYNIPKTLNYGESLEVSASARFSGVNYQYRVKGESNWTKEVPYRAGTYEIRVSANKLYKKNTQIFEVSILPKQIEVTINEDVIEFGASLSVTTDLVNGDKIERVSFSFENPSLNKTNVQVSELKIVDKLGEDVTSSYTYEKENFEIAFTPKTIIITLVDSTTVYDGIALTSSEISINEDDLIDGHLIEVKTIGSQTDVGVSDNVIYETKIYHGDYDVTSNYNIITKDGTLNVTPRPITIKMESSSKVYDGTPLTNSGYLIMQGFLVEGDRLELTDFSSQLNVGISSNLANEVKVYRFDVDVTSNYDITLEYGTLEITKRPISILTGSDSKIYDGLNFTNFNYDLVSGTLAENDELELVPMRSYINTGVYLNNELSPMIMNDNSRVTDNYEITWQFGTLEISKRPIEIQTSSNMKMYDAQALISKAFEISEGTLVNAHEIKVTNYTTLVEVGKIDNKLEIEIFYGEQDQTTNYNITYLRGILEVIPRLIEVKPIDVTKVYDGLSLQSNEVTCINNTSLVNEHYIVSLTNGSITDVGIVNNDIITIAVFDDDVDVSSNYEFMISSGSLSITKRPITIKPEDKTKVYDGTELVSNEAVLLVGTTLVLDHQITIETTGSIINVGKIFNTITSAVIYDLSRDVSFNYDITYEVGTLEVTKRPITIKSGSSIKVYDDQPLENQATEVIIGSLVLDHEIKVIESTSVIDVGLYDNRIVVEIYSGVSDVTSNYLISYVYGTLEVTPRPITIKTSDASKIYDGEILFNHDYVITSGSLVIGHYHSLAYGTSMTDVGVMVNELKIDIFKDTVNVSYNYAITYQNGLLEITPRPIAFSTGSASKVYDDMVLFNHEFTLISGSLVIGQEAHVVSDPSAIDVCFMDNELVIGIFDMSRDVSHNYEISYRYGTLEITYRLITIETGSSAKIYDGTPLFDDSHHIIEGELVAWHETTTFNRTYLTDVGLVENVLVVLVMDGIFDKSSNYLISYVSGTLEVSHRPITIKPEDKTKIYDGLVLVSNEATYLDDTSLAFGQVLMMTTDGSLVDVGLIDNHITHVSIFDDGIDVTSNYIVSTLKGILEVTHRPITIKPEDKTKIYDGLVLVSNDTTYLDGTSLAFGQVLMMTTDGSLVDVGLIDNHITHVSIFDDGVDVTSNYIVSTLKGTLEVIPRPVTLKTGSEVKMYDRTPLYNVTYQTMSNSLSLVEGHTLLVKSSSSQTEIGYCDNLFYAYTVVDEFNQDKLMNYSITFLYGLLEVIKIDINVYTESKTKEYDGTPLTGSNYSANLDHMLEGHHIMITVTGTIIEVGEAYNTITYQIVDDDNNDVSEYYLVVLNAGVLKVIEPRIKITLNTESDIKVYDGTALTNEHWSLTNGKLLEGHELSVIVTGSIVNVGKTANTLEYTITDSSGNDVSSKYAVTLEYGELIILEGDENGRNSSSETKLDKQGILGNGQGGQGGQGKPLFSIFTEVSENLLLRDVSYGDYSLDGFRIATPYTGTIGSPLQLPSYALYDSNSFTFKLTALENNLSYYMPYYGIDGFYDNLSDVSLYHRYGLGYELDFIPYQYDYNDYLDMRTNEEKAFELAYRQFVYENYLQIPVTTKRGMLRLAEKNGLNPLNETIIEDVQNYILNAAIYNLQFSPIPDGEDVVLYFLEHLFEGICQHFAAAGVMMYRALGIPARYTTGFSVTSIANEWTEVGAMNAHAWVEIYVDGFGWAPIEVTPGGGGSGTGNGSGSGTGNGSGSGTGGTIGESLPIIDITSGNKSKVYDGTPLSYEDYYVTGNLLEGHQIVVNVTGSINNVGITDNTFTVQILDKDLNDVSELYEIRSNFGSLVIVPDNDKPIIEFQVFDITKVYQGITFRHGMDYFVPSNNLPEGYEVVFDIIGEIKEVGKNRTFIDQGSLRIYDLDKMDVTNQYNVVTYKGSIEVLKRNITITTGSAQKYYDGIELTSDLYYISQGSLAYGHSIEVVNNGTITDEGFVRNGVDSILIVDSLNADVTDQYSINYVYGILEILESE